MAPTQRLDDRAGLAVGQIEAVVAVERVGLQNAGIAAEMPLGMLPRSIARGVEQGRRGILPAEWPVVADIQPNPPGFRLAFGKDRRCGVVAMQPIGLLSVLLLGLRVSCVLEVCGAFGGRVLGEDFAARVGDRFVASRSRLSQQSFELGEDLLDRIEVGRVFRQKDEATLTKSRCARRGSGFVVCRACSLAWR
jgi:hypothetical protein